MPSRKVTISVESEELAWLEQRAKRLNEGNLSAAFADGLRALRRREALDEFLQLSRAPVLAPDEKAVVRAEIWGEKAPRKAGRRSGRSAA